MRLVTRRRWGARLRGATKSTHPMAPGAGVTFHWEGTTLGTFDHSTCAGRVRGIERYHRDTKRWADIAYNAVVCPHGYIYEGRGPGVRSAANGDTGPNRTHYAVCYLGGPGDPFTDAAKAAFVDAVLWLRAAGRAGEDVLGHRDHKATECPGDVIYRWLHARSWRHLEVETVNHVEAAHPHLVSSLYHLREAISELRQARKSDGSARPVVVACAATLRVAYGTMSRAYKRLPPS